MLSAYETWPVARYWHGNPCGRAPMSRACMNYQSDLLKADYGLGQEAPGIVQALFPLVAIGFGLWALASLAGGTPNKRQRRLRKGVDYGKGWYVDRAGRLRSGIHPQMR